MITLEGLIYKTLSESHIGQASSAAIGESLAEIIREHYILINKGNVPTIPDDLKGPLYNYIDNMVYDLLYKV